MRKSLLIGAAAALLTAVLAADRVAAAMAADRLAARLRCAAGLTSGPSVSFGGVPFLDQLARRRFDRVHVTAAVTVGRFHTTVEATATDVRLPASGAARAASLTAQILLGYDELPSPVEVATDGSGRLLLSATRTVLGRELPVTVHAVPEIAGTTLTVRPVEVEIPSLGLRVPADRLGAGRSRSLDLPVLPAGLRYTAVAATASGLRLTVSGAGLTTALGGSGGRACRSTPPAVSPSPSGLSSSGTRVHR
ncbi:DUF2993 domain-containing protein [Actinoplanes sp. NPDC049802]|uniref:LmeA family phospholipid-binding protein n=1 Tax=Actinoplanes sp. NPDC049802 TaxID=3154742 RepID=UPI0033F0CA84